MVFGKERVDTMCWSLSRWMTREAHSLMGTESGLARISRRRHSAALCFTESIVSLQKQIRMVVLWFRSEMRQRNCTFCVESVCAIDNKATKNISCCAKNCVRDFCTSLIGQILQHVQAVGNGQKCVILVCGYLLIYLLTDATFYDSTATQNTQNVPTANQVPFLFWSTWHSDTTRRHYPDTRSFGMSWQKASAMSLEPMLAMHCRARQMWIGLRLDRSFLMDWMTSFISSLLALTSTEMNR